MRVRESVLHFDKKKKKKKPNARRSSVDAIQNAYLKLGGTALLQVVCSSDFGLQLCYCLAIEGYLFILSMMCVLWVKLFVLGKIS